MKAAAKRCGLTERTLYNYLADEAFRTELHRRQDQVIAATTAALVGLSGAAVATLQEVLTDPDASQATKVRAALGWLKHTRDVVELDALTERVAALEEKLREQRA